MSAAHSTMSAAH